jgi:sulfide:quinone oxidoreductase
MAQSAETKGMEFHYLPITNGEPFEMQARQLADLTERPDAKVFAYCRSGTRAAKAWALAEALRTGGASAAC